jgi:uncharacterized protein (DUF885 family)
MHRFSYKALSPTQRSSWASIEWTLRDAIANEDFAPYTLIFEQVGGFQTDLVEVLTSVHPVRNRRDVENYIARLNCVGSVLEEGMSEARAIADSGLVPPRSFCSA